MKYLKQFELFHSNPHYDITENLYRDKQFYYFTSENGWEYEVGFYLKGNQYFFGFKAKRPEDFMFDFAILTNDNPFKVLATIKWICEEHYKKYKGEKYVFSLTGEKEISAKRERLYMRILDGLDDWNIVKDPEMSRWYLTRKNDISESLETTHPMLKLKRDFNIELEVDNELIHSIEVVDPSDDYYSNEWCQVRVWTKVMRTEQTSELNNKEEIALIKEKYLTESTDKLNKFLKKFCMKYEFTYFDVHNSQAKDTMFTKNYALISYIIRIGF
jgi:hypothetical protein